MTDKAETNILKNDDKIEVVEVSEIQVLADTLIAFFDRGTTANSEVTIETIKELSKTARLSVVCIGLIIGFAIFRDNGEIVTNLVVAIACGGGGYLAGKSSK